MTCHRPHPWQWEFSLLLGHNIDMFKLNIIVTKHAFSTMILQLVSLIYGCENIYQITIDFQVVNLGFFPSMKLLWNMSFHVHEICGSIDNLHPQKNWTLLLNDMFDSFVQDGFILVFHYCMFMRNVYSFELSCNTYVFEKFIELLRHVFSYLIQAQCVDVEIFQIFNQWF